VKYNNHKSTAESKMQILVRKRQSQIKIWPWNLFQLPPLDKTLTFIGREYKLTEIAMHSVKENHFSSWPESKLKISGSV